MGVSQFVHAIYKYYGNGMNLPCHGATSNIERTFLRRLNGYGGGCADLGAFPERTFADRNGYGWSALQLGDSSGYSEKVLG